MRGLWVGVLDTSRLADIVTDEDASSAVAFVLDSAKPGDAIVLVRGLSEQDDDKRHTSAVLWRFPPWEEMRDPGALNGPRHHLGNPRQWRLRTIYTFDQPRPIIEGLGEERVFTIAYGAWDQGGAIPRHPSQGDWMYFGDIGVRGPSRGPGASERD